MIGYLLKQENFGIAEFFASWEELVETLEEIEGPMARVTIDICSYCEGDFKEKSDD